MKRQAKGTPPVPRNTTPNPGKPGFDMDGNFCKGNKVATTTVGKTKKKRVTAGEILDLAAQQLAREYRGTRSECVFKNGFSPVKEIMKMYAIECKKPRPSFDRKIMLLKTLLPYLYPQLKSIEFESDGELPILRLVMVEDDEPTDRGKGRNGHSVPKQAK